MKTISLGSFGISGSVRVHRTQMGSLMDEYDRLVEKRDGLKKEVERFLEKLGNQEGIDFPQWTDREGSSEGINFLL